MQQVHQNHAFPEVFDLRLQEVRHLRRRLFGLHRVNSPLKKFDWNQNSFLERSQALKTARP